MYKNGKIKNSTLFIVHSILNEHGFTLIRTRLRQNLVNVNGFTLIELLVVIILGGILAFAVVNTIDPKEQALNKRDAQYEDSAKSVIESLEAYVKLNHPLPWVNDTQSALPWTRAGETKIGICSDNACSAGEVTQVVSFSGSYYNSPAFTSSSSQESLFVAKGDRSDDPVWVCFLPQSKHYRLNWVEMKEIKPGDSVSNDGPKECPAQPDWNKSECYFCVSKKIEVPKP